VGLAFVLIFPDPPAAENLTPRRKVGALEMARANHHYLLGNHIWHINHRCHKSESLLTFKEDRQMGPSHHSHV
jgi:hypothetical protein